MKKIRIILLSILSLSTLLFSACDLFDSDVTKGFNYLEEGNYSKAFEHLQKAANKGNQYGEAGLADMYIDGLGVAQDYNKAFYYYKKAAERGNANSQMSLAVCYSEGIGTYPNQEEALKWLKKAAAQGQKEAKEILKSLQ